MNKKYSRHFSPLGGDSSEPVSRRRFCRTITTFTLLGPARANSGHPVGWLDRQIFGFIEQIARASSERLTDKVTWDTLKLDGSVMSALRRGPAPVVPV